MELLCTWQAIVLSAAATVLFSCCPSDTDLLTHAVSVELIDMGFDRAQAELALRQQAGSFEKVPHFHFAPLNKN